MSEPRQGRVRPKHRIRTAFEDGLEIAGLEDFTFHDLRHHFASWFVMRGGRLQALREILGHQDIKPPVRPPVAGPPADGVRQTADQRGGIIETVSLQSPRNAGVAQRQSN